VPTIPQREAFAAALPAAMMETGTESEPAWPPLTRFSTAMPAPRHELPEMQGIRARFPTEPLLPDSRDARYHTMPAPMEELLGSRAERTLNTGVPSWG
jgi:hypothetical protein